ncbi:hypothetical protein REPUB_Repub13aG0198500 [Reevesia pubescens]
MGERFMVIEGVWTCHNFECIVCNVYAPCDKLGKKDLWEKLLSIQHSWKGNWCFARDFSTIKMGEERNGCVLTGVRKDDFISFISEGKCLDLPLVGSIGSQEVNVTELIAIKIAFDVFVKTRLMRKVKLIVEFNCLTTVSWCKDLNSRL